MKAAWQRLTSRQQSYTLAAGIALVSLGAGYGLATLGDGPTGNSADSSAANEAGCKEVAYWYDPMKPDQHFDKPGKRSEEHTSELQSLMRNSYAVFCVQKKKTSNTSEYIT